MHTSITIENHNLLRSKKKRMMGYVPWASVLSFLAFKPNWPIYLQAYQREYINFT